MVSMILPLFLLFALFSLFIYTYVVKYYLIASRDIKRIEANVRAPIFSIVKETASGAYVIRAFAKEDEFFDKYLKLQHTYAVATQNNNYTNRWIMVLTDFFALTIVSGIAFFGVMSRDFNLLDNPALIGLCLTNAL